MRRSAPLLACLVAMAIAGCGADETDAARTAAERYVAELGRRDGDGACGQMTRGLQRQFTVAVVRAAPQLRGRECGQLMETALSAIPAAQLRAFAAARIEGMEVEGDRGRFEYALDRLDVDGEVAKENGAWKVSCCLPAGAGG